MNLVKIVYNIRQDQTISHRWYLQFTMNENSWVAQRRSLVKHPSIAIADGRALSHTTHRQVITAWCWHPASTPSPLGPLNWLGGRNSTELFRKMYFLNWEVLRCYPSIHYKSRVGYKTQNMFWHSFSSNLSLKERDDSLLSSKLNLH